ncbi:serine/arginine repetitive matrix protein 1 isoform X3 [Spodoptera frugiperda]|uniref:Serine/arginine repetitive matrix protein 1 isoform X3 n=1 Tax=Spodoptera frugiperda TaxID=7108 RepID=A0A9R0ERA8_SPOFR|nr:serine/arginine repetitive matrix protein 1 isoform X3 [Spodoptera frugiperda]
MLGARLKSWMEAQLGRAKKRKQKQARQTAATTTTGPLPPPHLSSPESAYSTGYSTDGTSPGTAPAPLAAPLVAPPPPPAPPTTHLYHEPAKQRRSNVVVRRCIPEPAPVPVVVCATPSPRPRCRIRTNPWMGATSPSRRRPQNIVHQQSLQCPPSTQPQLHHAPYSLDSHVKYGSRSPHLSPHLSPEPHRSPYYRGGASSDEECRGMRARGRETAILSDADFDSDGDTGLDGGDEDDDETASPGRRRARRRRPPRRPPRSAAMFSGATPPRMRRRNHAPSAPPVRERDPLLEADREAERKYRELIREAEKLLVTVSRAPLEPPHNPRVRELRATEVLQTLEGLRKSLQQQSALLAVQRTRLDSL